MIGNELSKNSTANNLGTSGPAGTTSAAAAEAANPGSVQVAEAGALPAGGTTLGGTGIHHHRVAVIHHITHRARRVARNVAVHHTHHVIAPGHS